MAATRWYPGFFTATVHRIDPRHEPFQFHGGTIGWSVCGVPVLVLAQPLDIAVAERTRPLCRHCT